MIFDRKAELPLGHRFYTSASTLASWGSGGQRAGANETYDSRGWVVAPKPVGIEWSEFSPKRIRPFRSSMRVASSEWVAPLAAVAAPGVTVRMPNDGPSADWRTERDSAGIADKHGQHATRIERWLVEKQSPLVIPLRMVKERLRPAVTVSNDNRPETDNADGNAGVGAERVHNQSSILPSVPEVLAAVSAAYRPHIVTKKCRSGHALDILHRHAGCGFSFVEGNTLLGSTNWRSKLTGLVFRSGELVAYGDANGRKRLPAYKADPLGLVRDDESETAKQEALQPLEDASYTRLKSAHTYVSAQSSDAPRALAPSARTARAIANDNVLAAAKANTKSMPTITRLPDGVAHEYGRLAGISESRGNGSAPMHEVLAEIERSQELVGAGLAHDDLEIVDAILDDASFRTIGLLKGYAESSAHRMGRKVVEGSLQRISQNIAA
ncbi:MAG: hypothetical protein H2044_13560 [Rhizobiales bacterium]|nr:hypothetical protein [Hyphomicrobiales bacterium]